MAEEETVESGIVEARQLRWGGCGKPRNQLWLGDSGGGNDHSNHGHHDSQGSAAKVMATRAVTQPSTVVAKAGTATLDGLVQVTINATTIQCNRRLF